MNKVRFAFCIAGFAIVGTNARTAPLYLVGVVILVLLFAEVLAEFVDLDGESNALIKKFLLGHRGNICYLSFLICDLRLVI